MSMFEQRLQNITPDGIDAMARLILLERRLGKSLELGALHEYDFDSIEISGLMHLMPWEIESYDPENCN
jgi:hypothetical protein